jgi:hypothetical protein
VASSGYITRTSLSLSNLAIATATYDVLLDESNGLSAGTVAWRRMTAESPWVSGRTLVQAVKDTTSLAMQVTVTGADLATVQSNVSTLLTAVWQTTYQLSLTLDTGAVYTWACEPADATVGFNYSHVLGKACPVVLSIPRDPTPVAGPI